VVGQFLSNQKGIEWVLNGQKMARNDELDEIFLGTFMRFHAPDGYFFFPLTLDWGRRNRLEKVGCG